MCGKIKVQPLDHYLENRVDSEMIWFSYPSSKAHIEVANFFCYVLLCSALLKMETLSRRIRCEWYLLGQKKIADSLITNKHKHITGSDLIDYSPTERIINFYLSKQAQW